MSQVEVIGTVALATLVGLVVTALWRLGVVLVKLPESLDGLNETLEHLREDHGRRLDILESRVGVSP